MPYRLAGLISALSLLLIPVAGFATPTGWQSGFAASQPAGLPPSLQVAQRAMAEGRPAEAVAQARAFLAAGPTARGAAVGFEVLGSALFLNDQPADALAALRRSVELDNSRASAWAKLGSVAVAMGDIDRGQDWLQSALRLDANQHLARERLGAVLEQRGNITGAIAQYEAAISTAPGGNAVLRTSLAGLYNRQGRFGDTIRLLQPLGTSGLTEAKGFQVYGTALLATDQPAGALPPLLLAAEQAPADNNIALLVAIAQRQVGQAEPALAGLRRLLAVRPTWVAAQFQLGLALISRSDYAGGRRAMDIAGGGDAAELEQQHLFVGPLALGARPDEAVALFEALASRPAARLADTALLARVCLAAGRPADVERVWRAAVARFPKDPVAHWRLINMLAAQQKLPAALQAFQASQKLVVDDPRLLLTGSMVQWRLGQPREAIALATRLVAVAPTDTLARLHLAGLQEATGDKAEAVASYRTVLAANPDNVIALNNLAALETDRDPPGAVSLARRAQRLRPGDPEVLDTLGWALMKLGRGADAMAAMREAVAKDPANPRRRYRLAKVQEAAGEIALARASLVEAITSGEFPEIDEARAALLRLSQ